MTAKQIITIVVMSIILSGCAGNKFLSIPNPELDTLYDKKKSKLYVFIENSDRLNDEFSSCGTNCRPFKFTHNAEQVVLETTKKAIETVFSDATYIKSLPEKSNALDKKIVTISFEKTNASSCTQGIYTIKQWAQVIISARVTVYDTRGTRLYTGLVSGIERATGQEGVFQCGHEDEVVIPAFVISIQRFGNNLLHTMAAIK